MSTANRLPLQFGLIGGLIMVAAWTVFYVVDPGLMASSLWSTVLYLPLLVCMFVVIPQLEQADGADLRFLRGLLASTLVGLIGSLVFQLFNVALHHLIDPGLAETLEIEVIRNMQDTMDRFDVPEAQIDAAIEQVRSEGLTPTFRSVMIGLGSAIAVSVFFGTFFMTVYLGWRSLRKPSA